MTARAEFLEAWEIHDRRASTFSARNHRATPKTLQDCTEDLVAARAAYAATVEISPVHLADILQSWRRTGFDHVRALRAFEVGWKERQS